MTSAVNDVAPTVKDINELRAFAAAHKDKPVIVYFSGVHANGTNCGACEGFEANSARVMRERKQDVYFVQMEVPLPTGGATPEAAAWNAKSSGVVDSIFGGIKNVSLTATPTMLELRVDAKGQLEATRDLNLVSREDHRQITPQAFDDTLKDIKVQFSMEKARTQALAALSDGKSTGSTVPNAGYNAGPQVMRG